MNHLQNILRVSSSNLEESSLKDCKNAVVDYNSSGQGSTVQELTGVTVACGQTAGGGDSSHSKPQYEESDVNEEHCAEEIEVCLHIPRQRRQLGLVYAFLIQ